MLHFADHLARYEVVFNEETRNDCVWECAQFWHIKGLLKTTNENSDYSYGL